MILKHINKERAIDKKEPLKVEKGKKLIAFFKKGIDNAVKRFTSLEIPSEIKKIKEDAKLNPIQKKIAIVNKTLYTSKKYTAKLDKILNEKAIEY